ncbi:MAG: LTA synthase family protein, partial [Oscillospiraceae bacterium]|nr:LTA synthase family protein [Oscillospiraceae bacterium]
METNSFSDRSRALIARAKAILPSRAQLRAIVAADQSSPAALRRSHLVYLGIAGTLLGYAVGLVTLLLSAYGCTGVPFGAMVASYFAHPLLLLLNLLPAALLLWLFAFLAGHLWVGAALSGTVCAVLGIINYYKIYLRGDPLTMSDMLLARTMQGIIDRYELTVSAGIVLTVLAMLAIVAAAARFCRRLLLAPKQRLCAAAAVVLLSAALYFGAYANDALYDSIENDQLINPWSAAEVYTSRGFLLPLLHTTPELYKPSVEEYSPETAEDILRRYEDADIPAEKAVTVMGVMLEAFCDLTDFPALANLPDVAAAYAPWHALEEESISGDLITDIFAGGTVESEWAFLTGSSRRDAYVKPLDSYVRYFNAQGYDTHYSHPGYEWFYERRSVNEYLGFDESFFTEDGFGDIVDPYVAAWHSDKQLVDYLLADLDGAEGAKRFSFAVSYQNHGPYSGGGASKNAFVREAESGLGEESCNILNAYLSGIAESIREYVRLTEELNKRETPVVLVLFGDHKPWLGNDSSVYREMGVSFDFSTLTGLENYHATPYLIWANEAAKAVLGSDFSGAGGDFSPCFLMPRLFDACGWEGPAFMQLAREVRAVTPLVHSSGLYLVDGKLTMTLSEAGEALMQAFLLAQAYREHDFVDTAPPKDTNGIGADPYAVPPDAQNAPAPKPVLPPTPVAPVTPNTDDPYTVAPDADDPYTVAPDA